MSKIKNLATSIKLIKNKEEWKLFIESLYKELELRKDIEVFIRVNDSRNDEYGYDIESFDPLLFPYFAIIKTLERSYEDGYYSYSTSAEMSDTIDVSIFILYKFDFSRDSFETFVS